MADKYGRDPRLKDFRNLVHVVWKVLHLPKPTRVQMDIAKYLQTGPDRMVIEAFRGVGKSWLCAAYIVYLLYWNPQAKVLIVSASKQFADNISTFILQIIRATPQFHFLDCAGKERHSKVAFDVGPAEPDKQASVTSLGITSQLTGNRADFILSDDVESYQNSITPLARERIAESTKEYGDVVKPGGRIVVLGTPQTEESLYNLLPGRDFTIRLWPVQYPDPRRRAEYGDRLAPMLASDLAADPTLEGAPTDPERFGPIQIAERLASRGRSGFALQYMLDTSLSDAERYPLRLRDLIIYSMDPEVAPGRIVWSCDPYHELRDLPAAGFQGDRLYGGVVPEGTLFGPYQGCVMAIDPAGGGKDETAYAAVRQKNGLLWVPELAGLAGGYSDATMVAIATAAKRTSTRHVVVERNFGSGMFTQLLQPHLQRIHPCTVEEVHSTLQKERRIIDTLEPVMNQHRLVVHPDVFRNDGRRDGGDGVALDGSRLYHLGYQLTHLTKDKGSLVHDDRLDALALGVAYWAEAMAKDVRRSAQKEVQRDFDRGLREFMRDADRPVGSPNWMGSNAAHRPA